MDVTYANNIPYSVPQSVDTIDRFAGKISSAQKPEDHVASSEANRMSEEVRKQVLMNLEDVQNFLYMLIGSKIRIDSGQRSIGSTVNTAA
jgi:hypothetical protein